MTALPATAQVMRDRLLMAVDGQSNICNMVVVMEVISFLEKHPITKEALEETRLGKLINDVRKKTKNEDLAKRAKKLLRNWQKLIEPVKGEAFSKGHATGAAAAALTSGKKGPELKSRNDFNNCAPRAERPSGRKCKGEQPGQLVPAKTSKTTLNDKTQSGGLRVTNGVGAASEVFTDTRAHPLLNRDISEPSDTEISEPSDNERLIRIPIHPVKPHPSAPGGGGKSPRTSSFLAASVLQQQSGAGTRHRPRSPRFSSHGPHTSKAEAVVKQSPPQAHSISRPGSADASVLGACLQPFGVSLQGFHGDGSRPADPDAQSRLSNATLRISAASARSDAVALEDERPADDAGKRKRHKFKSKDYVVSLDVQTVEDGTKTVRLKDRRLPFDPVTRKIETSIRKDALQDGEARAANRPELQTSPPVPPVPPVPAVPPSPFQQTDWKELSRSEIIQSYLSQQSNVLTSSGAHCTTGAHFFMTEFLKKEEHRKKDVKKTHSLASDGPPPGELPGVSREVTADDVSRLHARRWPGVNGCYDTEGTWYDWTECISLDPHGDESRLNILPYVCLD
ncbi:unnamed protein product [Ophioblennius macclurei]